MSCDVFYKKKLTFQEFGDSLKNPLLVCRIPWQVGFDSQLAPQEMATRLLRLDDEKGSELKQNFATHPRTIIVGSGCTGAGTSLGSIAYSNCNVLFPKVATVLHFAIIHSIR